MLGRSWALQQVLASAVSFVEWGTLLNLMVVWRMQLMCFQLPTSIFSMWRDFNSHKIM